MILIGNLIDSGFVAVIVEWLNRYNVDILGLPMLFTHINSKTEMIRHDLLVCSGQVL